MESGDETLELTSYTMVGLHVSTYGLEAFLHITPNFAFITRCNSCACPTGTYSGSFDDCAEISNTIHADRFARHLHVIVGFPQCLEAVG